MDALTKRILLAALVVIFLVPAVAVADISYRWTDEAGEVHYRPTPPTDPDQPYVMLRDGQVVERYAGLERPEIPESEFAEERRLEEEQRKRDALLLVQFRSLDDIDEAMEAQLAPIQQDYKLIDGTYASLQKSLFDQIEVAANRQRAGLPVSQYELDQVMGIRERMNENRYTRSLSQAREDRIRKEHEEKRERFLIIVKERENS
jgi:hypothetical protein